MLNSLALNLIHSSTTGAEILSKIAKYSSLEDQEKSIRVFIQEKGLSISNGLREQLSNSTMDFMGDLFLNTTHLKNLQLNRNESTD